ncbi:MAG: 6-phosphogluconolactonase [Anaerolineales bacterium]|jgi:6-phosphogluconolactonase
MSAVRVYPNDVSLAQAAAEWVVQCSAEAIEQHGTFNLALSGGSTPRRTFELLADEDHVGRIDWQRTYVFWGDERCVPPDHPESNYRMARQALLDHVPIPAEQIYRMQGELTPQIAADVYERILRAHFLTVRGKLPDTTFDLVLLGLGSDGHTASLFPGTDALSITTRWSTANHVPQLDTWRLTLTFPCINAASHVAFLVSGENKAQRLRQVIHGETADAELPAHLVQPRQGKLVWLVDEAAASAL